MKSMIRKRQVTIRRDHIDMISFERHPLSDALHVHRCRFPKEFWQHRRLATEVINDNNSEARFCRNLAKETSVGI